MHDSKNQVGQMTRKASTGDWKTKKEIKESKAHSK